MRASSHILSDRYHLSDGSLFILTSSTSKCSSPHFEVVGIFSLTCEILKCVAAANVARRAGRKSSPSLALMVWTQQIQVKYILHF
jgi:hypothetical protein